MAGRTVDKHSRVYIDGYDFSGYTRSLGAMPWEFDYQIDASLTDEIKGGWPGRASIGLEQVNGMFDNTATTGFQTVLNAPGVMRTVMIPIGIKAAPAQGDPCWMAELEQVDFKSDVANGMLNATMKFGGHSARGTFYNYPTPWGWLLRPYTATTAVNSAVGIDDLAGVPTSTAYGGYMAYQIFARNGTVTIKVQDAATNADGSFADLSGCTTGVLSYGAPGIAYGMVAIGKTATVRRYLRWQIVLGTATTVTFALAFVRGYAGI